LCVLLALTALLLALISVWHIPSGTYNALTGVPQSGHALPVWQVRTIPTMVVQSACSVLLGPKVRCWALLQLHLATLAQQEVSHQQAVHSVVLARAAHSTLNKGNHRVRYVLLELTEQLSEPLRLQPAPSARLGTTTQRRGDPQSGHALPAQRARTTLQLEAHLQQPATSVRSI